MPFSYPGGTEGLFPTIRLTDEGLRTLSLKELKGVLGARGVAYASFLQKSEFRDAVTASEPNEVEGLSVRFDSKWQAAYVYALHDSLRSTITEQELTSATWRMLFRGGGGEWDAAFREGGEYWSDPSHPTALNWVITSGSPGAVSRIRVGDYPDLIVHRDRDNWRWEFHNSHVIFKSVHYGVAT